MGSSPPEAPALHSGERADSLIPDDPLVLLASRLPATSAFLGKRHEHPLDFRRDHHIVSPQVAVSTHLFPDIADAILEWFTPMEDSIFHPGPATDDFPAP